MTQAFMDPAAFRAFEALGWAGRADAYHRFFGPISTHVVDPLLDAARVGPGPQVLDLASGPGYGAAQAATRGAAVVGIDQSASMVRLAARLHPGLTFCRADAEHLPFANGMHRRGRSAPAPRGAGADPGGGGPPPGGLCNGRGHRFAGRGEVGYGPA